MWHKGKGKGKKPIGLPESRCHCGYCKITMPVSEWDAHAKTPKHIEGLKRLAEQYSEKRG